jgi:hypothetical protein
VAGWRIPEDGSYISYLTPEEEISCRVESSDQEEGSIWD